MSRRVCSKGWGAVLTAGVLLLAQTPAIARESGPRYDGAEGHYAGSQIALHEGVNVPAGPLYGGEAQTLGHDVSGHQGEVDWPTAASTGAKFVYVKATEGTGFVNPRFVQQYNGSYGVGLIRGAYHFARPDISDGAAQAHYFVDHGGGWSKDGKTLPGALDVEYNPYGETCYGKTPAQMVAWVTSFATTYLQRTGRHPTIYTSTSWWKRCTGNSNAFWQNPLWLARYNTAIGELPASWKTHTIWQFADKGSLPGDQNWFNGTADRVSALSLG
ncbi:lysozyme [Amycolatopsis sp. cmx-4-54]|uniref:lysozyme n=1 Tax=Amycolatopsis sp. cmx-4-54 TaxID=2790936 RepID=UPI003979F05E